MTDNHWLYFPGRDVFFTRAYEPKVFSPACAPPGRTAVCVESSCFRDWTGEPFTGQSPEDLVIEGMERCGLVRRADVLAAQAVRVEEAYPVLAVGYAARLKTTLAALSELENGYALGRQGLFNYNNTDLSIKMGLDLAGHVEQQSTPGAWYRYAGDAYSTYRIVD
jgi:protoporphyrinogen oxidase